MQYNSVRIFRTVSKVVYEGVVHEVPSCSADEIVPRACYIEDGSSKETAERSRKRFHRDLALLLPEVNEKRGNFTRNVFYLAQTYECLEKYDEAIQWYTKRTTLAGFMEEVYMSYFRLGRIWHKRVKRDWPSAQNYYLQGHGINPRRWECPYKIAKYYYKHQDDPGAWNLCHAFAHMAVLNSSEPGEHDLFAVANIYTRKMPNVYCMSSWYCDNVNGRNHEKARELLMKCIEHFPKLPSPQKQIAFFNDRLKTMHVTQHYPYPAKIVHALVLQQQQLPLVRPKKRRIVVTMTTCKRFDLFTRTINSFLTCCTDVDLVDQWIIVDDNSSADDRMRMQKLYPFFKFIFKTPEERGHAKSMNMLQTAVLPPDNNAVSADLIFHLEDDWLFLDHRPYMTLLQGKGPCWPP
jgi:tetratricopeptide (TPR) repeat protein